MSERMIDECAKAMAEAAGWNWGYPEVREGYCKLASAVLTRLREPTPGMNQAGAHAALIQREGHMGIFRAMIGAALEGK